MKKIKNLKEKTILTVCYLAIVLLLYFLGAECIFKKFLGVSCPGCGMTRAFLSALRFDFTAAFKYHFMFWSMPILYLYFLLDGKLFKHKKVDLAILIIIAIGFVVNWLRVLF